MIGDVLPSSGLEARLAQMLGYGTWLGCAVIAVGLALSTSGAGLGSRLLTLGVGLFIALPVLRVLLMLVHFLRTGERWFAVICAAILLIIFSGVAASVWMGT
jgi:uncharacterized membrane protein